MSHYRSQLNFTWETVENAQKGFTKLCRAVVLLKEEATQDAEVSLSDPSYSPQGEEFSPFVEAICSDLNTPKAMAWLSGIIKDGSKSASSRLEMLYAADAVLGLGFSELTSTSRKDFPDTVQALLNERAAARASKEWARSDTLREELLSLGYQVKDTPKGQEVEQLEPKER
jgi:cysteinyl-tRNA synthetase